MAFLASHPDAGNVIPRSGGCRKIRWSLEGRGKSGSVRVIYTTQLECGAVVALLIYGKSATENIPAHILYKIAKEMTQAYQRLIFNPLRPACRSSASSINRLTSSL